MGGRSGSTSQANQTSSTVNQDNRIVNDSGIVAQNSALSFSSQADDHSFFAANSGNTTNTTTNNTTNTTTNIKSVDSKVTGQAFDFATSVNNTNAAGFDKLLQASEELTRRTQDNATTMASRFQDGMAQAFDSGRNTTPGGVDNKTVIILGISAAAALAVFSMNKGK